ncbi:MAG: cupredoxin domain-containing protein [Nanoarchaeota archaeon]|nr:cupredoxin domain-containing protein [Nanoarchaeota archaeon]
MAERAKCEICNRDFPSQDALAMHNSAKHLNQENIKANKSGNKMLIYFIVIFLIAAGIVYFAANAGNSTGNVINSAGNGNSGDIQKINISFKNYNYYPNTITVKEGQPVEITLDSSVRGCYRSFNIKSLGVSKSSSGASDTIKFTPNKKGTFEFACGMRMGTGTIIVE